MCDDILAVCDSGTDCGSLPKLGQQTVAALSACENTCHYASDTECDDGGSGAEFAVCGLGSECVDCGPRLVSPPPSPKPKPPPSSTCDATCTGEQTLSALISHVASLSLCSKLQVDSRRCARLGALASRRRGFSLEREHRLLVRKVEGNASSRAFQL